MMLVRDYASCHVARRTVTYNACSKQRAKSLTFKSYRPLVEPTEMQGSCLAAATKSQGARVCNSPEVCGHSIRVYA